MNKKLKQLIPAFIILALSAYNLKLYFTGDLLKYINPRYSELSLVMSLITLLFCIAILFMSFKKIKNEKHRAPWVLKIKNLQLIFPLIIIIISTYLHFYLLTFLVLAVLIIRSKGIYKFVLNNIGMSLLVVLIVLGLVLPAASLSDEEAKKRLGDLNTLSVRAESQQKDIRFSFDTENFSISDWVLAFNSNPNLNDYVGKKVNLTGFIFNPEDLADNEFLISRFVIRCCAVDATPAGIPVKLTNWKDSYKENDWVTVQGIFKIEQVDGEGRLVISDVKVEKIPEPDDPYIY